MSLSCCVMSLSRRVVARRPLKPFQYQQHADLTSNQRSVSAGRRAGGGGSASVACSRRLLPPAAACCRLPSSLCASKYSPPQARKQQALQLLQSHAVPLHADDATSNVFALAVCMKHRVANYAGLPVRTARIFLAGV